jgi:ABC-type glycerol-3-phosphate transport system substrate-binding protein
MYAKGWFSDPRSNEEINDFVRGKGVMYLFGDWAVGLLGKAGFPLKELGVFILPNAPGVQQPAIIVEGAPIVVSRKGAANPDVMKTLRFWVSNQGAQTWGKASGNYIGNNKIAAPNAIVSQVNKQLAQTRHAMFLRWWERRTHRTAR